MITIEKNPKLGYYTVDNTEYYNKVSALINATQLKKTPTWNFNGNVFNNHNWAVEPELDLRSLYRIRAKQLREKYDYIRLEFSGGSDSTTVAYSFINNNIHLDEVVVRHPIAGEKNLTNNNLDLRPENFLSEFELTTKPLLDWIAINSPRTKITIHDYSLDMLSTQTDESWILRSRDYFIPTHAYKHTVDSLDSHKTTLDKGKSVCMLWGVDKPKICISNQAWYLFFTDQIANIANPDHGGYTNLTNEYFFWTPDLPEIVCKQAHTIMKWFSLPSNQHLQHIVKWPNTSWTNRAMYEQLVKSLIYPDYDINWFQTSKSLNGAFFAECDQWFYSNFKETHAYRAWQAGLKYLSTHIAAKYFSQERGITIGLSSFITPLYYLGSVKTLS